MNSLNIPFNSQYHYYEIPSEFRWIFLKTLQIRDFQEINMKPKISKDSELGGRKLGGFTVVLVGRYKKVKVWKRLKTFF